MQHGMAALKQDLIDAGALEEIFFLSQVSVKLLALHLMHSVPVFDDRMLCPGDTPWCLSAMFIASSRVRRPKPFGGSDHFRRLQLARRIKTGTIDPTKRILDKSSPLRLAFKRLKRLHNQSKVRRTLHEYWLWQQSCLLQDEASRKGVIDLDVLDFLKTKPWWIQQAARMFWPFSDDALDAYRRFFRTSQQNTPPRLSWVQRSKRFLHAGSSLEDRILFAFQVSSKRKLHLSKNLSAYQKEMKARKLIDIKKRRRGDRAHKPPSCPKGTPPTVRLLQRRAIQVSRNPSPVVNIGTKQILGASQHTPGLLSSQLDYRQGDIKLTPRLAIRTRCNHLFAYFCRNPVNFPDKFDAYNITWR